MSIYITSMYLGITSFVLLILVTFVRCDVLVVNQLNDTQEAFGDYIAEFSPLIPSDGIKGKLVMANPDDACTEVDNPPPYNGTEHFLLARRYGCSSAEKALRARVKGYKALIIYDVISGALRSPKGLGDGDLDIPTVMVDQHDGLNLKKHYLYDSGYFVVITPDHPLNLNNYLLPFAIVVAVCFVLMLIFTIVKCYRDNRRRRRNRLPGKLLKKIPIKKFKKGDEYDVCAICLDDYKENEKLRILPCSHAYHTRCVDPWLTNNKRNCPVCKRKVFVDNNKHDESSDSDDDGGRSSSERTPLLTSSHISAMSNYGVNPTLLTRSEELPGPSSAPTTMYNEGSSISNVPEIVTIVPSLHSVNGDNSEEDENNRSGASTVRVNIVESEESRQGKKNKQGPSKVLV